ncbi:ribosomal protein S14 [Methanosalsum zhilinae DSM 4017]|uniref:Small ribosomal subunit protein uS14 n=1 Tax=Methanosalsum zhilinae (strain DSM 4017 / NBRC 107636 / OCM 62 / WeN5) TaxID=679901 RepID=F7XMP9_METZD|nr:ribosomal protein S14 [Methanosalsum zhilinae DSM 4017]
MMAQVKKEDTVALLECRRCGRKQGLVRKYGICMCRHCFREMAHEMGFEKYT